MFIAKAELRRVLESGYLKEGATTGRRIGSADTVKRVRRWAKRPATQATQATTSTTPSGKPRPSASTRPAAAPSPRSAKRKRGRT